MRRRTFFVSTFLLPLACSWSAFAGECKTCQPTPAGSPTVIARPAMCQPNCEPSPPRPEPWMPVVPHPKCGPVTCLPWQVFAQGEYVGPPRLSHVPIYRLRVDDQMEFVFRLTRDESPTAYQLNVGDVVLIESLTDADMNRGDLKMGQGLVIQPDGTITLRLLGQVRAAKRSVEELRADLIQRYKKFYKDPDVTVTPLKVNTKLEDLRAAIDARMGVGGQTRRATITPEGTIQLPGVGNVPAQGLTIDELKQELDERFATIVEGIEVTPVLVQRAPRHVFVLGEVFKPGRYDLVAPTSTMQAIALAGGWNYGGNLKNILIFRRTEDWRLIVTQLDMQNTLWGRKPCAADELWLRDSDIVLVPKSNLQITNDFISMIFTRGIYGVMPFSTNYSFGTSTL